MKSKGRKIVAGWTGYWRRGREVLKEQLDVKKICV